MRVISMGYDALFRRPGGASGGGANRAILLRQTRRIALA
jgi:hypothetical protein